MGKVLLLDTYSLFFRAFHALPAMNTRAGRPTNALYGFSSLLLKLWRTEKPLGSAFALDAPQRTFRHDAYAEYKAGRARAPDALLTQLESLTELLEAVGAPTFCVPGFEADDVVATLSRELEAAGHGVLVVSGDRDLLQGALLSALDRLPPALAQKLRQNPERTEKNAALATLRRDVPLPNGPRFSPLDADALRRLGRVFEALEFKSLLGRLSALG